MKVLGIVILVGCLLGLSALIVCEIVALVKVFKRRKNKVEDEKKGD